MEDDPPARREALRVLDREAAGRGDDRPAVADLAAALRIERRPVEHDLSVLALLEDGHLRQPADDELDAALPVDHLVAEELGRVVTGGDAGQRLGVRRQLATGAARLLGPPPLDAHVLLELGRIDGQALLGGELGGEVEREPVGVVQLEDHLAGELGLAPPLRGGDLVLQAGQPPAQRVVEAGLLAGDDPLDQVRAAGHLGVVGTVEVDGHARQLGEQRPVDAEQPRPADRPADEPAQHVAPTLVGGKDAVGDEQSHRPGVVGQHPQAHVGRGALAVGGTRDLLGGLQDRREQVGLERGRDVLEDGGDPLQARRRVDARFGEVADDLAPVVLEVLHEDEVPDLEVPLGVDIAGALIRRAEGLPPVVEQLRARPARAGDAHRPEVVAPERASRQPEGPGGDPDDLRPDLGGFLVRLVDRGPQTAGLQQELLGDELPGPPARVLLEVVPEGEVAEHLEEGQVAGRPADVLQVDGAEALLHRGRPAVGGRLLPEEVGLERHHAGVGEEQGRVIGDQGGRGHDGVAALGEEVEEDLADAGAVHASAPAVEDPTPQLGFRVQHGPASLLQREAHALADRGGGLSGFVDDDAG